MAEHEKGRRGPLSNADKKYIADYHLIKTTQAIADALKRDELSIRKYIKQKFGSQYNHADLQTNSLKTSPIWDDIEQQFSSEELRMFTYHYGRIVGQFKDDVFPTEELQVIDLVKIEILMNRILTEEKRILVEIANAEALIQSLDKTNDKDQIFGLERQVGAMRGGMTSIRKDYNELLKKKSDILRELKATREARVKNIESGKNNYGNWMKQILQDKERREEVGLYAEKMRIATTVEYERLSDLHQYLDGQVDQPILTPENVMEEYREGSNNGN